MKQSSKLLFTSLFSMSFAAFAMDQQPAGPEKSIDAFKRDIKELGPKEFERLNKTVNNVMSLNSIFGKEVGVNDEVRKALVNVARNNQLLQRIPSSSIYTLLQKYQFPLAQCDETTELIDPISTPCLHPVVMSLFTQRFQQLIQKRKDLLLKAKLEDNESVDTWDDGEKIAFGTGVFNTELKTLKSELIAMRDKAAQFFIAIKEVEAEQEVNNLAAQAEEIAKLVQTLGNLFNLVNNMKN